MAVQWYCVTDMVAPPEDAEAIVDYILSGGTFSDVATPMMFIKELISWEGRAKRSKHQKRSDFVYIGRIRLECIDDNCSSLVFK